MLQIETLSVFPDMFGVPMSSSILGRAQKAGLWSFKAHDLRDWTYDRHRSVDDVPYGGGQGMLIKCVPVFEALDEISAQGPKPTVVFFTPTGRPFNQGLALELSQHERIVFVCGRYEGFDERAYALADYCISLGDYVLTGGELPAMVVTDAIVRLLPGALGNAESSQDESFSHSGLLEYEQYTRPASYRGMEVPAVLVSGDHQKVDNWRRLNAIERTVRMRPDLIGNAKLSDKERQYAEECMKRCIDKNAGAQQ